MLKLAEKHYNKKTKKAKSKAENVKNEITKLGQKKQNKEKLLIEYAEKFKELNGEIIGLVNANTFLESNFNGGLIEKILKITVNLNNKKIKNFLKQQETLRKNATNRAKEIAALNENINFLQEEFNVKQKAVEVLKTKTENIFKIGLFVNPIAGLAINAQNEQKIADLEKFMYRQVTEMELEKIKNYTFTKKKIQDGKYIIRFLKEEKNIFDELLTA